MNMRKYNSAKEAKAAIAEKQEAINIILEEDLVDVAEDCRTIGKWLDLYGRSNHKNRKKDLLEMEQVVIDANLFLRHMVTKYDLDVGSNLGKTFH
jgi:hypothetical protein